MKFFYLITFYLLFFKVKIFSQPANDEPCNSISLPVLIDVLGQNCKLVSYSWVGATQTGATPNPTCITSGTSNIRDVWFKLVVPPSGKVQLSVSALLTYVVTAYGGACTATISLRELSCYAYTGLNTAAAITLTSLTPGTTIYVRITRTTQSAYPNGAISICASEILDIPAIDNSTGIGIGTKSPLAKLDIAGTAIVRDSLLVTNNIETRSNLKAKTLQITNGAAGGNLLQSDANGNATWISPEAIAGVHYIGESYGGGIVYYVTPNSLHGLIAETQDQGYTKWYNAQDSISTSAKHSSNGQNYTDWRLPTKNELDLLYLQRNVVGGFMNNIGFNGCYWSSQELQNNSLDLVFARCFGDDGTVEGLKDDYEFVRAVRTF